MKPVIAAVLACLAAPAAAQKFSPNDVSILLEAPVTENDARLRVPDEIFPADLAREAAAAVARVNGLPTAVAAIDTTLFTARRDEWHVASLRIDPGAPGSHEAFAAFGRNLQVRLVVQPVSFDGGPPIRDEAVHLVYTFGTADTEDGQAAARCPFRVLPGEADMGAFATALDDLADLRDELTGMGVETDGTPLGVHPAFQDAAAADHLVGRLEGFLRSHLSEDRLSAVSVAGIPEGAPEPWVFLALQRDGDGFVPVPGPAVAQPGGNAAPNFQQALSFLNDAENGAVVPPGLTRNLMPVDCLANFVLPKIGLPQPDPEAGFSTSSLFGTGNNGPDRAAEIGAVIADPAASHFFNTDCVSCHTETRREMDAGADTAAVARRIAAAENIVAADLPRSPDGMGTRFDRWNVRAFGWYPGFPAMQGQAHATVTRRTARETAEVVACLNDGDWRRLDRACLATEEVTHLNQGWSEQIRRQFYHTSEGGKIMPLAWFLALEEAGGRTRFAAPENLTKYGLLRSERDDLNPNGLPVGFAVTGQGADAQVSLNCAACHAGNVIVNGKTLRVDGAPSSFDFDAFAADLAMAVRETGQLDFSNPAAPEPTDRLKRFIGNVALTEPAALGGDPQAFVMRFLSFTTPFAGEMAQRRPAHPSGPGRVDALTQIVNSLAVRDLGLASNLATPAAPTSYPPLWLTDRLEFVQWNLAVADPLSRNIGQALGVFGSADLTGADPFGSSADRAALELNEQWISDLSPPLWPEDLLGPIDVSRAEEGRDLFVAHCEGCHNAPPFRESAPDASASGDTFVKVTAVPAAKAATDGEYTRAFTQRWVDPGPLADALKAEGPIPAALYLGGVVSRVTAKAVGADEPSTLRLRPDGHPDCGGQPGPCGYRPPLGGAGLKAGPLMGLWSTGPYLHNGSVRTVYQVISPPEERESVFFIGEPVLDAERIGFVSDDSDGAFRFDTSVPGNGNGGHVFWKEPFTHDERMAIIEYLKNPARFPVPR